MHSLVILALEMKWYLKSYSCNLFLSLPFLYSALTELHILVFYSFCLPKVHLYKANRKYYMYH